MCLQVTWFYKERLNNYKVMLLPTSEDEVQIFIIQYHVNPHYCFATERYNNKHILNVVVCNYDYIFINPIEQ